MRSKRRLTLCSALALLASCSESSVYLDGDESELTLEAPLSVSLDSSGRVLSALTAANFTAENLTSAPGTASIRSLASMNDSRAQHASALLSNGQVLVVAGVSRTGFVASAERFDPASGLWSRVASPGLQGNVASAVSLPQGKVYAYTDGASAALYDPATDTWAQAASPGSRSLATFVLLQNGQLLIAGGSNLATAVLYDPEANTNADTGSMSVVRRAAASVLLRDGRALVIGGFSSTSGEVAQVEQYDPASGTFSLVAPLAIARHYFTATLLTDGRVLIAGGFTAGGITTSTALYDPVANTWTNTAPLKYARNGHTATLLPNGKVLVVGGSDSARNVVVQAELYDPASGTWTDTSSLAVGRENHSATLLPSGKVLIAGGYNSNPSLTFHATSELYDPALGTWSTSGDPSRARAVPQAALLLNGKVLVTGDGAGADLYDRSTESFSPAATPLTARRRGSLTVLASGKVLLAGGLTADGATSLQTAEVYDPVANTWTAIAPMAQARHGHTATRLSNGTVWLSGGEGASANTATLYDPETNVWSSAGSLKAARTDHAATLLANGKVLLAGGLSDGSPSASAELFDLSTQTSELTASLAQARRGFSLVTLPSGQVLAVGGRNTSLLATSELFDPATSTWSNVGALNQARTGASVVLLPSGNVLAVGGYSGTDENVALSSVEQYEPATRVWTRISSLNHARAQSAFAPLPSGEVLVIGGRASGVAVLGSELYRQSGSIVPFAPSITSTSTLRRGCAYDIEGQFFRGVSGASSGSYLDSVTSFPSVRLQAVEGSQLWAPLSRGWSASHVGITVPSELVAGPHVLSIFANAISGGQVVQVGDNAAPVAQAGSASIPYNTETQLTLTASDAEGLPLSFVVVTPPSHGSLSTASDGKPVYTPATDYVGPDSFSFVAEDECGTESSPAVFNLTIKDSTPPSVTCPDDILLEIRTEASQTVTWSPAQADDDLGTPTLSYSATSGSSFGLGQHQVTATATDTSGNTASCSFNVWLLDIADPVLTCPEDIFATATREEGAEVGFPSPDASDNSGAVTLAYSPASGSTFSLGTTRVTATASDAAGNQAECGFEVHVAAPVGDAGAEPVPPSSGAGCGCSTTGGKTRWDLSLLSMLAALGLRRTRAKRRA